MNKIINAQEAINLTYSSRNSISSQINTMLDEKSDSINRQIKTAIQNGEDNTEIIISFTLDTDINSPHIQPSIAKYFESIGYTVINYNYDVLLRTIYISISWKEN